MTQLIDLIFSSGGLLHKSLPDYEERKGQKEMAHTVLDAYERSHTALIEAGTGIGKSLAYLVPAVFWALKKQEKTVISTHTIALQEQLFHKDIPFLLETMDLSIKVSLVKGSANYLCLRKLDALEQTPLLASTEEAKEVQQIERWAEKTKEGSRSSLPMAISPGTWEKVQVEHAACTHVKCPHYKQCFFFKARKEAEEAQLLIVNHALLLADVEKRRKKGEEEAILPSYQRLVIDEAHHLEAVALESFAERVDRVPLIRQLSKVHADNQPESSRLMLLRKELATFSSLPPSLIQKLEIDLPALRRECQKELDESFKQLGAFFEAFLADQETKKKISEAHTAHPDWKETIIPHVKRFADKLMQFSISLQELQKEVEKHKSSPLFDKLLPHLLDIQSSRTRIEEASEFLEGFIREEPEKKRVRWIEMKAAHFSLADAALDVSGYLNAHLFEKMRTLILCSATLTASHSFSFLKQRLGLCSGKMKEEIYPSPFDYSARTLLLVPTDLPAPTSPAFLQTSIEAMKKAIEISRGSVFLLFTSYDALQKAHHILSQTSLPEHFPFFAQGEAPRHLLLERFKDARNGVLFGTDSFWEGVDVPGEALRCVVITKLPFSVPTDPLYQAYAESLEKEGLNPFFDYSVPQAVIKFKQGFGRLMRSKKDHGCVICLDQRLATKNYGKQFLTSLPQSPVVLAKGAEVFAEMQKFYSKS